MTKNHFFFIFTVEFSLGHPYLLVIERINVLTNFEVGDDSWVKLLESI